MGPHLTTLSLHAASIRLTTDVLHAWGCESSLVLGLGVGWVCVWVSVSVGVGVVSVLAWWVDKACVCGRGRSMRGFECDTVALVHQRHCGGSSLS